MAIKYMTRVHISEYTDIIENSDWLYTDTLTSAGNGDKVIMPTKLSYITMVLIVSGGGTGKIQVAFDSEEEIIAGNETWFDWNDGEVTANTFDTYTGPVRGVRQVNAAGTTKLIIGAN
jgi:hypothetical protein